MSLRLFLAAVTAAALCPAWCLEAARAHSSGDDSRSLFLSGQWQFRLDPNNVGRAQKWFAEDLPNRIALPGTTDQAGFGTKTVGPDKSRLSRVYQYVGPAWYQRDVTIPDSWQGKRINLLLERCMWRTDVWIDQEPAGTQDSLCTPHWHRLPVLNPGRHTLTIRVDNSLQADIGEESMSYSGQTSSIWNGIVGRIELRATDPVWIERIRTFPDVETGKVRLVIELGNETGREVSGTLRLQVETPEGKPAGKERTRFALPGRSSTVEVTLSVGESVRPWDEFSPSLYAARVTLECKLGEEQYSDRRREVFGFRKIAHNGKQITINGRPTFIRGTMDFASYPLTGYPPMDIASWQRIFDIVKSHGFNQMRYHSWCPPEAAFAAADRAGLMLEVETPLWIHILRASPRRPSWLGGKVENRPERQFGYDPEVVQFIRRELDRILSAYGNHPSFCMMVMGNEVNLDSDYAPLIEMIKRAKQHDPRRLYAVSTARKLTPADDIYITHATPGGAARGLKGPRANWDFSGPVLDRVSVPVIAHEIGQRAIYPDYDQIGKYTGVLRPRNLEVFRDSLAARGMAGQSKVFQQASGALAWRLYKAEMEAMLRTPKFGGYQLLLFNDCLGFGEGTDGITDVFWDPKGLIAPERFRQFCCETVPLLRFAKYVWTSNETFTAQAQVAHYGPKPLTAAEGVWSIKDHTGRRLASGSFPAAELPVGEVTTLGQINLPLSSFQQAECLTVTLSLKNTPFINEWNIWVYPKQVDLSVPKGVIVSERLDQATRKALAEGKKVLLLPPVAGLHSGVIRSRYMPVFWSYHYSQEYGLSTTLGVLCNPKHPALKAFPTEPHSDWQWWELAQSSKAFILNRTPHDFQPIVQIIDNPQRNHKLGAIFETRVGPGRLLVCGFDLKRDLDNRPAARQMLFSLLQYMQSEDFQPTVELKMEVLEELLGARTTRPTY